MLPNSIEIFPKLELAAVGDRVTRIHGFWTHFLKIFHLFWGTFLQRFAVIRNSVLRNFAKRPYPILTGKRNVLHLKRDLRTSNGTEKNPNKHLRRRQTNKNNQ